MRWYLRRRHCGCVSLLAAGVAAHSHGCNDAAMCCASSPADGSTLRGNMGGDEWAGQLSAQRWNARRDLQCPQPPAQTIPYDYSPRASRGDLAQHGSPKGAVVGVPIAAVQLHPRIAVSSVGIPAAPGAGHVVAGASSPVLHARLSASGGRSTTDVSDQGSAAASTGSGWAAATLGRLQPLLLR